LAILKASVDETTDEEISESDKPDDERITLTIRKTAGQISQAGQEIIKLVKAKGK
jgi:hypothetical protein